MDGLEQELVLLELHIGRVRARQMVLLAELDRRQVALADGCRSMVEWTAGRLGIAPETAAALIRTSRTCESTVTTALAEGAVTFDRAVELLRLAGVGVGQSVEAGASLDIGGLRHEISRRRPIVHPDGGRCAIDGCNSRHRLQPHHIIPFSEGGATGPENLTTLCWFHHHVVIHGLGYRLDPGTPPQRRRFLTPDSPDPPNRQATAAGRHSAKRRQPTPMPQDPESGEVRIRARQSSFSTRAGSVLA